MRFCSFALILFVGLAGPSGWVSTAAEVSLVQSTNSWHMRKGRSAVPAGWKTASDSALDTSWAVARGGFGYSDSAGETAGCATLLTDMRNSYTSVAIRRSFEVTEVPAPDARLYLTLDWDDGFIAFLNGEFLVSHNVTGQPAEPAFDARASDTHESSRGDSNRNEPVRYDLGPAASRLTPGTHVLAIVGLNQSSGSSDFVLLADLTMGTPSNECLSGALPGETVWRQDRSPIRVCGDITVPSGAVLRIEPGVVVQMNDGVDLIIANGGVLLADGSSEAPILFTRAPGATAWGQVIINGAEGSPESRIQHARFEFNASSSRPCIDVEGGTAVLNHLRFDNNRAPYIHVDRASFVIRNCFFPAGATSFELLHGSGGVRADGRGIFSRNYFGSPLGYNDSVDFTGGIRPGPVVHFFNNVFVGSQDDVLDLDGTDAWVEGNIFLHVHRNGSTPDSASAVSGGSDSGRTSDVTVLRNIFFNCDNAATAKQGNFFTFIENTVVKITKTGGVDIGAGVVNSRDTQPSVTAIGRGFHLRNNVIVDVEQLVRNYDASQTLVTFEDNLLSLPWPEPGKGNVEGVAAFERLPTIAETQFSNWQDAQAIWDWVALKPGTPGSKAGPGGFDWGASTRRGVVLDLLPSDPSLPRKAVLRAGPHLNAPATPAVSFAEGSGFPRFKWRVNGGTWSDPQPISQPVELVDLEDGGYLVEAVGQLDTGIWQDDPDLAEEASVSKSLSWVVGPRPQLSIEQRDARDLDLQFSALPRVAYRVEYRDSLADEAWKLVTRVEADALGGVRVVRDAMPVGATTRFYRLVVD